jgi:hypothetical protein
MKTVLIEGVGWPEQGKLPQRFKHDYVKPVRVFKNSHEKAKVTNEKFDEWLKKKGNSNARVAKRTA